MIEWLDENFDAEAEEFKEQMEILEGLVNPIVTKLHGDEQASTG